VAAMNPCPCGYHGDNLKQCTCSPYSRNRYRHKISGPLLDRIDLHIEVPRVKYNELSDNQTATESSAVIKERVTAARAIQAARFEGSPCTCNAKMSHSDVECYCQLEPDARALLSDAFRRLRLSARAHDRILKVARTIADLVAAEAIQLAHVAEAIQYRSLDREEEE